MSQRTTHRSIATVVVGFVAALASADPLPPKYVLSYEIHETPGNPATELLWTIDLHVTPVQRIGSLINWHVTKVAITDHDAGRTWLDDIPSAERGSWWVYHADPNAPAEGEFCDVPLIDRTADPVSGTTADLEYQFHTDCGSAAAGVQHGWWIFSEVGGPTVKDDDRPIVVSGVGQPT